jgi:hypothetical protein
MNMRRIPQRLEGLDRDAVVAAARRERNLDEAELARVVAASGPMGGVIGAK